MQQAGAGGAAETVQERQRSGSCQVGGTAALRTHEAALVRCNGPDRKGSAYQRRTVT